MKKIKYNLKKILLENEQPHWAQEHINAGKPIPGTLEKLTRQHGENSQWGDLQYDESTMEPEIKDFMKSNPHLKGTMWDELSKIDARNYVLHNPSTGKTGEVEDPSDGSHFNAFDALSDLGEAGMLKQGTHEGVEHDLSLANLQRMAGDLMPDLGTEDSPVEYTTEHAQDFANAHSHKSAEENMYDMNQFSKVEDEDHMDKMLSRMHNHMNMFNEKGPHEDTDSGSWHNEDRRHLDAEGHIQDTLQGVPWYNEA